MREAIPLTLQRVLTLERRLFLPNRLLQNETRKSNPLTCSPVRFPNFGISSRNAPLRSRFAPIPTQRTKIKFSSLFHVLGAHPSLGRTKLSSTRSTPSETITALFRKRSPMYTLIVRIRWSAKIKFNILNKQVRRPLIRKPFKFLQHPLDLTSNLSVSCSSADLTTK